MDSTIKPCPFCGGSGYSKVLVNVNWREQTRLFGVECRYCGANMPTRFLTAESAITAWNKRIDDE